MPWEQTQAKLQLLESYSKEMQRTAAKMQLVLTDMTERPAFETRAEDELRRLEIELTVLVSFTRAAIELYSNMKPTA